MLSEGPIFKTDLVLNFLLSSWVKSSELFTRASYQRYLEILRRTGIRFLKQFPVNERRNYWSQLNGAPAHNSPDVHLELSIIFQNRWIGPKGSWREPPLSPDSTPLDFLWGFIFSWYLHFFQSSISQNRGEIATDNINEKFYEPCTQGGNPILCLGTLKTWYPIKLYLMWQFSITLRKPRI